MSCEPIDKALIDEMLQAEAHHWKELYHKSEGELAHLRAMMIEAKAELDIRKDGLAGLTKTIADYQDECTRLQQEIERLGQLHKS